MTRDLRKYTRQTNFRLLLGFFLILFVVGDGLIYVVYGPNSALLGLICMLMALAPVILIAIILWVMDWAVRKANQE